MRYGVCLLLITGSILAAAQTGPPPERPPQSARQALIEMLTGKGSDDFAKHLPDDARRALIHKGETLETSIVLRIGAIGRTLASQGGTVETFDAGPNILVSDEAPTHTRLEVVVEHDNLNGDEDEIELSFRIYKDGQLQSIPVVPRLTFTLRQEHDVWRLIEATASVHVPLTDPDYLKELRREQDDANERAARTRIGIIAQAETTYAANRPDRGFSCTLTKLFPDEGSDEDSAAPTGFAVQESGGYRFALSGCSGTPSAKYRITASPIDSDSEMKAFCSDESGRLKWVENGKTADCFKHGQAVDPMPETIHVD